MNKSNKPARKLARYYNLNNRELDRAKTFQAGSGTVTIFSRSSPNNEEPNEDSAAIIPVDEDTAVLMVADGVGGLSNGKDASMMVLNEIRKAVNKFKRKGGILREGILNGIEKANKTILKKLPGAASTLAVAEIQDRSVSTYNVGDSEILITDDSANIKYQSIVQSPVGYAVEAGMLNEEQAIMHDERHLVSNVVGDRDMHIDISSNIVLEPGETLLLATDGLFDNMQKNEIIEIIKQGELQECSHRLVERATARMFETDSEQPSKFDDMSFILFRLNINGQ